MNISDKKAIISKIGANIKLLEKSRSSKVIVYFNGEKEPIEQFGTQIALDVLPNFRTILEGFKGKVNKITLVLNTSGGNLEAPWPIVNLIREYCKTFEVLILERALSAGTMISLGSDKIIMSPYSHLSPIDPAANIFDKNTNIQKRLEIEDIIGYIDFAKDKVGIAEQNSLTEVMKELTKEISPTILGSVNRTHSLIRKLSKNLLSLNKNLTEKQIREITENLTEKLYSHRHLINRKEAKNDLGFNNIIEFANDEIKNISNELIKNYFELFEMENNFKDIFNSEKTTEEINIIRAAVHSEKYKFNFKSIYEVKKIFITPENKQISINNIFNNWEL